jgi:hypothetical protein
MAIGGLIAILQNFRFKAKNMLPPWKFESSLSVDFWRKSGQPPPDFL